ncbi:TonB-dependent siderophore receptor [Pseudomonas cremoricolorata]|uniref:TonB-dependent siderophore receptor n=1 Tax=Pseudomonas cremoricolorata TaxID=157783 RepID=UPI0004067B1C|nr:TonB-dependent siderophore receptor [Pseudomonas cremoricolorata]
MNRFPLCRLALFVSLASASALVHAAEVVELGASTITADADSLKNQATTEGTRSYTTGAMSTSAGLPLSVRQTPQSVSVITRQRIEDQGLNDLSDVVKSAPGVTLRKFGSDRQEFLARGFRIDNIMFDGLPSSMGTFSLDTLASPDMAIYDRIEVVRGATGLTTGAGDPSATLNLVRKRPTDTPQVSVTTSAGSWDRYRTEVDASNKLNDSGTVRGRVVAAYADNHSFVDVRESKNQTFYGVLEADLDAATTVTLGASKQRQDKTSDWGSLPSGPNGEDLGLSRSTYLAGKWGYWDQDNYTLFGDITHTFANGWKTKLALQKMWNESDTFSNYVTAYPYTSVDDLGTASGHYLTDDDLLNVDASLSGAFDAMGREHEFQMGISRREQNYRIRGGYSGATPIDIYAFDPGSVSKPSDAELEPYAKKSTTTEKAAYAVARLNPIDPLHVILGGRVSWFDFDSETTGRTYTINSSYKTTREFTPYAGVIYDLNDTYSAYASYTEIYKPQEVQDRAGKVLDPMTGESYEIGLKGEYFNGALNASVALFDMTQQNRSYALDSSVSGCNPSVTCYAAAGEVRSRGIDTELTGALTPNWNFSASYTLLLSQYTKDDTYEDKRFAPEQPKHLFKAATTYNLTGELSKWRVGADVFAQSETYNRVGTGHAVQDSYAVLGLMAGYRFDEHWDGRVNFNNVTDEKYWQGIPTGTGMGTYGDPRNLMFSLKWTL